MRVNEEMKYFLILFEVPCSRHSMKKPCLVRALISVASGVLCSDEHQNGSNEHSEVRPDRTSTFVARTSKFG